MITCNGEPLTSGGSVADLVRDCLGDPPRSGIAVAVNGEVVPRATWSGTVLVDGDVVEVVTAVQGG